MLKDPAPKAQPGGRQFRHLYRSLIHYRRLHLAVLLGAAVATAVLTGALLVGDSVRGSLRALTLLRLGRIDAALVSPRFVRQELATLLKGEGLEAAGAILLDGTAVDAGTRARAGQVQVQGIDAAFAALFDEDPAAARIIGLLGRKKGQPFPPVVINRALQRELGIEVGQDLLLGVERPGQIQRGTLFGERRAEEVVQTLRLRLAAVLEDGGLARFGLRPHQSLPYNAYVDIEELQQVLGVDGRVNALLAVAPPAGPSPQETLGRVWSLEDAGLELRSEGEVIALQSTGYLLSAATAASALEVARSADLQRRPLLTYLATSLRRGEREVPYSLVSGLDAAEDGLAAFVWSAGVPGPLQEDEVLLNEWTARQLGAGVGDGLALEYFEVGPREELIERTVQLRVRGIVAMEGPGADRRLTPEFPGMHAAGDMTAWDAPFPVDLGRVRPVDEAYWDEYGAAPKAFVALATARRLWESHYGALSAIWIGVQADTLASRQRFAAQLLTQLQPQAAGLAFRPVRQEGLEAASGATDFGQLFIGFSFFLIVAAALLVGLLFRLGVEQRAAEVGLLLAVGFGLGAVRRRLLAEGALLAVVGGLLGVVGALLYAQGMLTGLRTWWRQAVGTESLSLHLEPFSLALGLVLSLGMVLGTVYLSVRRLGRVSAPLLLRGAVQGEGVSEVGRGIWVGSLGTAAGLGFLGGALAVEGPAAAGLFFGAGAALLLAGLGFIAAWLGRQRPSRRAFIGGGRLLRVGVRNSRRNPGRSLLCAGLVACAAFVILAVGANRRPPLDEAAALRRDGGTGGYVLVGRSAVPLPADPAAAAGREQLGLDPDGEARLAAARIWSLRHLPGEDASCLNLYRPQQPTLLGVAPDLVARGGFTFGQTLALAAGESPWELLHRDLGAGVVPAIADFNSAQWILHVGLGEELEVPDGRGGRLRLRLVGLLQDSIFQGELLISEAAFKRAYPERTGFGFFLIEAPPSQAADVALLLEEGLEAFGFDAESSVQRLAAYHAVENTYLSTFQALGGLGMVLGTLGLGVVLMRNALERRAELAALRAFGFRRRRVGFLLLAENGFLLLAGLGIGLGAALVATLPQWLGAAVRPDWYGMALTLGLVLLGGLGASSVATLLALQARLLPALRGD